MPVDAIKLTVKSIDIPDSWITAEEARETATSITNKNFVSFMNKIMEEIKKTSLEGKTSCFVSHRYINIEIIQRAKMLLTTLGYEASTRTGTEWFDISWK